MANIRPFAALRPPAELAKAVASVPYDVIDSDEARELVVNNPASFLHVTKPEVDLPPGTNLYADEVYAKGLENLKSFVAKGILVRDDAPRFYVYRQTMGDHTQTGIVAGASVAEYDGGTIKKHELTRPNKEDDRTRHILTLRAQTGPVFLTYPQNDSVDSLVASVCETEPTYDFVAIDGIGHTVWVVTDDATSDAIAAAFKEIPNLYIADGHHRSAAASRVAKTISEEPGASADGEHNFFLSVIFPDNQMKILDYNRVVADLHGLDVAGFLGKVGEKFEVTEVSEGKPEAPRTFRMYLDGKWMELRAKPGTWPEGDPVNSLDVAILQNNLLSPILGIDDPRRSERIDFVGGIRGTSALRKRVEQGAAVAFALYPTSMSELIAIADAGEIMPPKSTWFEPKLRSGLLVRPLT